MAVLSCLTWGVISFITLFVLFKWYLPNLRMKSLESAEQEQKPLEKQTFRKLYIAFYVISIVISMFCGYISGSREDEMLSVFKMILALCVLNVIAITDFELYKIPNLCVLILLIGRCLSLIPELVIHDGSLLPGLINSAIAGGFSSLFLLLISKITRGGIGYGDIKLFGALGFLCGVRAVIYTLMLSFFICAIVSVVLLLTKKKGLKDGLPLGPFIWLGFATTIICGLC